MSRGRCARRLRPAGSATACAPSTGGCTFAEDPAVPAPRARILWTRELDPEALPVAAEPCTAADPDAILAAELAPWLTVVADPDGRAHAVLSDGFHRIRLDLESGMLGEGPVKLRYLVEGLRTAQPKLLSMRRLIDLCLRRRFARTLFPADPRIGRWLLALRVHDALRAGASQREIAALLFGAARVQAEWTGPSDAWKSRVRRLVAEAQRLAGGGYRSLLQQQVRHDEDGAD